MPINKTMKRVFFGALCLLGAANTLVSGQTCTYVGNGKTSCRLDVVQDVWIERPTTNYNNYDWLLIAKHPGYPLKRSLLQFEDFSWDESGCSETVSQ